MSENLTENNSSSTNGTAILPTEIFYELKWIEIFYSVICQLGVCTSILNMIIFSNDSLKDPTYKFLFYEAVIDFFYAILNCLMTLFTCGTELCSFLQTTLESRIYTIVVNDYLTSSMAMNNIFIELFLSVQRMFTIDNRHFLHNVSSNTIMLGIFLLSLAYYAPVLFLKRISTSYENGKLVYYLTDTEFRKSDIGKSITLILTAVRLFLVTVCLFFVNVITFLRFQSLLRRKSVLTHRTESNKQSARGSLTPTAQHMTNSSLQYQTSRSNSIAETLHAKLSHLHDLKAKRNLTLMITSVSVLFAFGNLPWTVYYILVIGTKFNAGSLRALYAMGRCCLFAVIFMKVFIYYFFNRLYREVFDKYAQTLFYCFFPKTVK